MSNSYFQFKQFTVHQDRSAMKVTTDASLFGGFVAEKLKAKKIKDVLDIGSGTGLLSLMFAQKNNAAVIDAIEIDASAYEQGRENISSSPFANRIHAIHGDVKTFFFEKKYDLVISNPPFYENELKSGKENKNLAHHGDGLTLSELFLAIKKNLAEDGIFFLLLPYKRFDEIRSLLAECSLIITELTFIRQSTQHDYFRIILQGKCNESVNGEIEMNEISTWNEHQQYTAEFIELLKDYYLYL